MWKRKDGRSSTFGVPSGVDPGSRTTLKLAAKPQIAARDGDYLVPTNKDIPQIECILLDFPDPIINQYGARGIGEIGLTGVASALTSAVYHATGVRIRDLPIRIEKLMRADIVT